MKITKFTQSCLLIETRNKRILIDPGSINFDESLLANGWDDIDILLVTHKHSDHFCEPAVAEIVKNPKTKLYSSNEVAQFYPGIKFNVVADGDVIDEGAKIEVVKAIHGFLAEMDDAREVIENIGFILTIEGKRVYVTSDTISFRNDYKCDILCIPVSDHGVVMGAFEAAMIYKVTGANLLIPVHMDNPRYPVDLGVLAKDLADVNYKVLAVGESLEI